jgi:Zn-dependent protease
VPVNFAGLRNPKLDMVWVAAAGPGMNILLAALSVIAISLPSLLGWHVAGLSLEFLWSSVQINLVLAVLNMLPVPPLDGGRVAVGLLPQPLSAALASLNRFGMLLLLAIFVGLPYIGIDIFRWLVQGPVEYVERLLMALLGLSYG